MYEKHKERKQIDENKEKQIDNNKKKTNKKLKTLTLIDLNWCNTGNLVRDHRLATYFIALFRMKKIFISFCALHMCQTVLLNSN